MAAPEDREKHARRRKNYFKKKRRAETVERKIRVQEEPFDINKMRQLLIAAEEIETESES